MKNLILVGAGSFGREICAWLPSCIGYGTDWVLKGFLDSDMTRLQDYERSDEIVDLIGNYTPSEGDVFLCTIADQAFREKYTKMIFDKGGQFISVIHNTCVIDPGSKIGFGVFVAPFCTISCDTTIGNHVLFNSYAAVGHDVVIEDFCHINSFVLLGGFVKLHTGVTVHPNSVVIPQKEIGEGSTVGAGAVVIRDVKANTTVFGNPAKVIF